MASPHVLVVAALVWSNHPDCSNEQIRDALTATAQRSGERDDYYGHGIVQDNDAVSYSSASGCGSAGDPPTTSDPPTTEDPSEHCGQKGDSCFNTND